MVTTILRSFLTVFRQCATWFENILNAVGGLNTYYTAVFTALTVGFLLSRFGSAMVRGSDLAASKIKRKGDK